MNGPQSLAQFHFDKEKSGKILRKWADESGLSRQELAEKTGIPIATLNNSLYGKVQDLTIDRTFKIATATGHCLCEYIKLQLEDADIAFADEVHVLRDPSLEKQKALPSVTIVEEHHAKGEAVPDHLLDRFRRVYEQTITQLHEQIDQLKESRAMMRDQYEAQIAALVAAHNKHHTEVTERSDREIERLQKQVTRLRTALIIETSAIGLLFFVDALVGDRGWILRSLFHTGDGMDIIRRG